MHVHLKSKALISMPDWCKPGGSRGYVVTRSFGWNIGRKASPWVLTLEAGREFESSVPRWLTWAFLPDDPLYLKAAAVHDKLLETGHRRAFADSQWYEAALSERAPRTKTRIVYLAMVLRRYWRG
jgi:hypothetical protein